LHETLSEASHAQPNGDVNTDALVAWLTQNSDEEALVKVLRGVAVADSRQRLYEAVVRLQTPPMLHAQPPTEMTQRHAALLKNHVEGSPPIFDTVHRGGKYAYTASDEPSALAREIASSASELPSPDFVVDLGAGNARDARDYTRIFPHAQVVAVDNSHTALEIAHTRRRSLSPDRRDRLHIVDHNIFDFLAGGRERLAELLHSSVDRSIIALAACSSLHFSTRSDTQKLLQGIVELIGREGWLAALHRTTKDPFGRPGILLQQSGDEGSREQVRIHGEDGLARRFWDLPVQERLITNAGGRIVRSRSIVERYDSAIPADFGCIVAVQNGQ
jgi:SAM-dependent methyltransferase